jgi:cell division septum initiation protein DivIVA
MQFILLEKFYALERENKELKQKIKNLETEIESLKEKITVSKKIDESHADELVKQLKFNTKK